jgi:hypothetical protein
MMDKNKLEVFAKRIGLSWEYASQEQRALVADLYMKEQQNLAINEVGRQLGVIAERIGR